MIAGLTARLEMRVEENDLSPELRREEFGVLSTPRLVQLLEATSREAVREHLAPNERFLGTGVNIRHLASTPAGMKVTAHALLKEVRENRLLFLVDAYDETEKVAEGELEGILVPEDQIFERVRSKRGKGGAETRPGER
jgi:fluoroacetyl-CoA thioesterase